MAKAEQGAAFLYNDPPLAVSGSAKIGGRNSALSGFGGTLFGDSGRDWVGLLGGLSTATTDMSALDSNADWGDYEISESKLTYAGMIFKRWERPKKEPEQKESQNEPQSEQK